MSPNGQTELGGNMKLLNIVFIGLLVLLFGCINSKNPSNSAVGDGLGATDNLYGYDQDVSDEDVADDVIEPNSACPEDYTVEASFSARNGVIFDIGGGTAPTAGTLLAKWWGPKADSPALLLSDLQAGDEIELESVTGHGHLGASGTYYLGCSSTGYRPTIPGGAAVLQFSDDSGVVQTAPVYTPQSANAMLVAAVKNVRLTIPEGATRLYGGVPDWYPWDNSPASHSVCSLTFHIYPKCDE